MKIGTGLLSATSTYLAVTRHATRCDLSTTIEELEEIQQTLIKRIEAGRQSATLYKRELRTNLAALKVVNKQIAEMQKRRVA